MDRRACFFSAVKKILSPAIFFLQYYVNLLYYLCIKMEDFRFLQVIS